MNDRRCGHIVQLAIFVLLIGENHGKTIKGRDDDYCDIQIDGGLAEPQPLILCPDKGRHEFVYPAKPGSGHVVAKIGESFRIACPGSQLDLNTFKSYNDTLITCVGENYFVLEGTNIEIPFDKISCEKYPNYVARRTGIPCGNGASVEIGFPLQTRINNQIRTEFHRLIDLCHDETLHHTIYAHARIFAVIDAAQKSFPRTSFRKGNFFRDININAVYGKNSQRETIARLLNSTKLAWEYIPKTGSNFFSRGHLIAKTDFIYGSHQRATFSYVNAVPMWQSVNAGNFLSMETNVRSYATKRNLDLDVWAGSYGILSLKDFRGKQQEIYLHVDRNKRAVPVPKIVFKVVYNYQTQSGIVFLVANNPYLKNLTKEYRICKNICYKIDYMTWQPNRNDRGLSYCCEIDDFRQAFPNIPCFETKRLLT